MVYTWQDIRDNKMCTVEVHMPSASISEEFHLHLEESDETQFLVIKYRVGGAFFDEEALNGFIKDFVEEIKDASSMSQARHNKIQSLKKKHSDKINVENKFCNMTVQIKLPFFCEDIFDIRDYHGQYENTGKTFRIFNTEDEKGEIVSAHVLITTMVAEKKQTPEEVLKRNTPQTRRKRGVVARKRVV